MLKDEKSLESWGQLQGEIGKIKSEFEEKTDTDKVLFRGQAGLGTLTQAWSAN